MASPKAPRKFSWESSSSEDSFDVNDIPWRAAWIAGDEESDETQKKAEVGEKRPSVSADKTRGADKKAKVSTPQKAGNNAAKSESSGKKDADWDDEEYVSDDSDEDDDVCEYEDDGDEAVDETQKKAEVGENGPSVSAYKTRGAADNKAKVSTADLEDVKRVTLGELEELFDKVYATLKQNGLKFKRKYHCVSKNPFLARKDGDEKGKKRV